MDWSEDEAGGNVAEPLSSYRAIFYRAVFRQDFGYPFALDFNWPTVDATTRHREGHEKQAKNLCKASAVIAIVG